MKRTQAASLAVIALALVALAVALPAAATSGATNAQEQANETPAPNGSFDQDIYEAQQGDVVAIDVSINNTDTAMVVIGGQEKPYTLQVNVTDGNDDNVVELQFDTSSPESDDALTAFRDADSVTVLNRSAGNGEFAGSYGLTLSYNGTRLASAAIAVQADRTPTTTTTTATTTATTTTESMDSTETTTSDGQPGFGIAAALVAVAAAAMAATRR